MTDAEWLKDNIESLWGIANGLASYSGVQLSDKEIEVVKYFIEQAERVQKLEVWEETARNYFGENASLKEESNRYLEALKYYADKSNWKENVVGRNLSGKSVLHYGFTPIQADGGDKARQAIKGESSV